MTTCTLVEMRRESTPPPPPAPDGFPEEADTDVDLPYYLEEIEDNEP